MEQQTERRPVPLVIPGHVMECGKLSLFECCLLAEINQLARKGTGCFAKNGRLAVRLRSTREWVNKTISKLKKAGFIVTDRDGKMHLSAPDSDAWKCELSSHMKPKRGVNSVHTKCELSSQGCELSSHRSEYNSNKKGKEETTRARADVRTPTHAHARNGDSEVSKKPTGKQLLSWRDSIRSEWDSVLNSLVKLTQFSRDITKNEIDLATAADDLCWAGITADDLSGFLSWWRKQWMGQKQKHPVPQQVVKYASQFVSEHDGGAADLYQSSYRRLP